MWRTLDDLTYRIERALIVVCVAGMTLLVGADVTQRTFSRPVGKTAQMVIALRESAGPIADRALWETIGEGVFIVVALLALWLAAHQARRFAWERTDRSAPAPGVLKSAAIGAFTFSCIGLSIAVLLWLFPSSVPGAQKLALGLMLWSGLLGASVAARERGHIVVDTLKKKVPEEQARVFALSSGVLTGLFCAFIALLGVMQLGSEVKAWAEGDGVGMYESVPLPMWIGTLAVPVTFLVMSVRFFGYALSDFRHGPKKGGDGGHGVDLDALAAAPVGET